MIVVIFVFQFFFLPFFIGIAGADPITPKSSGEMIRESFLRKISGKFKDRIHRDLFILIKVYVISTKFFYVRLNFNLP